MYQSQGDVDQLSQTIMTNIRKISQNVNSMQQMIMQLQSAPSSDNESVRQQLNKMQTYTNQLAKETSNLLKELSANTNPKNKIVKDRLANDFSDTLKVFQSIQYKEVDQGRADVQRARAASQRGNLIELARQLPAPPGGRPGQQQMQQQIQSGTGYQQALMMEEESNLEMLREREEAVKALEQNILDVNGIFKELATMVHEQAGLVDSIEANVDNATIRVAEGAEQLSQARHHQERARRKQICLISTGIIALAILITIIYYSAK
ncbi:syntaxin-7-like [Tropilaelaps mercedesae]|uniref:Syntaxin-7-like n=1 Tax=Tropilaelaps mercedesae TaxID=418985 RepID=A0A1V9X4S7_9ACAR|nr:syntaxin-7-like [Tropilaelaps mercedesae]